jgi:hypothetical protein
MDSSHPIPQDITGFQFRLIGSMTIKQFAYVAISTVFGWTLSLFIPVDLIVRIPIVGFFTLIGFGVAFLPIAGRPADIMIGLFFSALLKPTSYKKTASSTTIAAQPAPSIDPAKQGGPLTKQGASERLVVEVVETPAPPPPAPSQQVPPTGPVLPVVPDSPNLLSGVVIDARGKALYGILVEVTDTHGNPVRALKTNDLGHFIAATPLLDGTYTVTCEDPKNVQRFSPVVVVAEGKQIPSLTIRATDERESLRKELFGA